MSPGWVGFWDVLHVLPTKYPIINCILLFIFQLNGEIDDCQCNIESVDVFNNEQVHPILDALLKRDYFRYYKVSKVHMMYNVYVTDLRYFGNMLLLLEVVSVYLVWSFVVWNRKLNCFVSLFLIASVVS